MNLGKIARFSEEIRPQTARYAMKREVAAVQPVFPLSMSDFKPGDRYFEHAKGLGCNAPFCAQTFLPTPGYILQKMIRFFNAG